MKLMKYIWFLLLPGLLSAALPIDVASKSALLINSKTGKVLYEKNASEKMYPASCTKIAFALYAIKFYKHLFDKRLICSHNAVKALSEAQKSKDNYNLVPSYVLEHDASHMGLKVGEEMRFYDLLEATMIVSADDASNVLAEVMGNGSIEKCVEDVNRFVRSLGCKNTCFKNPHGLHHPEHVTSAYDLALLCQEAMKEPLFCEIIKKTRFLRPKTNKQKEVHLATTNRLMMKNSPHYFPHAAGIKTGYHRRAGHCFATCANKGDRSLISVLFQSPSRDERFKDAKRLFEVAFSEMPITKTVIPAGKQSFQRKIPGAKAVLETVTTEPVVLSFYPSEEPEFRCELLWSDVELPLTKGALVGELHLYADGSLVKKATLYAANGVEKRFMLSMPMMIGIGVFVLLAVFIYARAGLGAGRGTGRSAG